MPSACKYDRGIRKHARTQIILTTGTISRYYTPLLFVRRKTFWYLEMRKLNFNLVFPFIEKRIFSPIPTNMKMKNQYYTLAAFATLFLASCGALGKKDKGSTMPNDGQLHGIAPGSKYSLPKPPGMVFV